MELDTNWYYYNEILISSYSLLIERRLITPPCHIALEDEDLLSQYVERFYDMNSIFSKKRLTRLSKNPLYLGQMALALGDGDGLVCGLTYTTAEVVLSSTSMIGLTEDTVTPSSFFIMDIPQFQGSQEPLIALSDGGLVKTLMKKNWLILP